ncbi:MAG: hypothetical protein KY444_11365 [Gemmatimonadetes bacterium]|nr:hypothetical protein [Gemmatimonadota bacterium]
MQTLVTRESYDAGARSLWWFWAVSVGALVAVKVIFRLLEPRPWEEMWPRILLSAGFALVLGGTMVALLLVSERDKMSLRLDQAYRGYRGVVGEPPLETDYPYRLPCGRVHGRTEVSGVLYLGAAGMRFVPHLNTRAPHADIVELGPAESLVFELVPARNWLFRWLNPHRAQAVKVRSATASETFTIPTAATTIELMKSAVRGTNVPAVPH